MSSSVLTPPKHGVSRLALPYAAVPRTFLVLETRQICELLVRKCATDRLAELGSNRAPGKTSHHRSAVTIICDLRSMRGARRFSRACSPYTLRRVRYSYWSMVSPNGV
jgi:hypothetical protein